MLVSFSNVLSVLLGIGEHCGLLRIRIRPFFLSAPQSDFPLWCGSGSGPSSWSNWCKSDPQTLHGTRPGYSAGPDPAILHFYADPDPAVWESFSRNVKIIFISITRELCHSKESFQFSREHLALQKLKILNFFVGAYFQISFTERLLIRPNSFGLGCIKRYGRISCPLRVWCDPWRFGGIS